MPKAMLEKIGGALDRRGFLSKLVTATGALLVGIVVMPKSARAVLHQVGCCFLCIVPDTCTYNSANCATQWLWACCANSKVYHCWECFIDGVVCNGSGCQGVICSKITCHGPTSPDVCPEIDDQCPYT